MIQVLSMNTSSDETKRQFLQSVSNEARKLRSTMVEGMKPLAEDFVPGPFDVICARGRAAKIHSGNQRYKQMIEMNLAKYKDAKSKNDKSYIVSSIIDSIRDASPHGGFVKEDNGKWYEVGDHIAREKVGQG